MKKSFYQLSSSQSFTRVFSTLFFAAIGLCVANQAYGWGGGWNVSIPGSHHGLVYSCFLPPGEGVLTPNPAVRKLDYGTSNSLSAVLMTCEEFTIDSNGTKTSTGRKGQFTLSAHAENVSVSCDPVSGDPLVKSRRTYTGFCTNDPATSAKVSAQIMLAPGTPRPGFCPTSGLCQFDVPLPGLPTNNSGNTTTQLCNGAFPLEPASTPGHLGLGQMVLFTELFDVPSELSCPADHALAGGISRLRGCHADSWDPTAPGVGPDGCLLKIGSTTFRHVYGDSGTAGQTVPGELVQNSFKLNCTTNGVVKYRIFSRPAGTDLDFPGPFAVSEVDLNSATLEGVRSNSPGILNDTNGDGIPDMAEFTFSQCAVGAAFVGPDFTFKAKLGGALAGSDIISRDSDVSVK